MKPKGLTIYGQSGQIISTVLAPGWNPLPQIHAGVWVYDTCMVFWNACPGAGELYIDRINVAFDSHISGILPRANWSAASTVLTIGAGLEYIPPRGSLRIRWAYPTRCPDQALYGPSVLKFAASQRRTLFANLASKLVAERDTGMWAPFGERQPDAPGGTLIGSLAGWEQDGAYFLLRHDLTMERMAIGALDQNTGLPIPGHDLDYTTVRGWTKSTQREEFTQPPANQYQEERAPYVTWPGSSPYRDLMLGKNRANSYLPYDAQHLCRALIPAKAAAQCGDPVARFDLDMIAVDCRGAREDESALPFGSRGLAWTIDAYAHSRPMWYRAQNLANAMVVHQTASGAILRAPYGYSFSPSPWDTYGMPRDEDADAMLERAISCHALALHGKKDAISLALAGQPHPMVKFVGVGRNQSEVFAHYQNPCGPASWEIWLAIGAAAALAPRETWWHTYALTNSTPGGKRAGSLSELRTILRGEFVGEDSTAVLRCVLEALPL